jgi:hypothetical protein
LQEGQEIRRHFSARILLISCLSCSNNRRVKLSRFPRHRNGHLQEGQEIRRNFVTKKSPDLLSLLFKKTSASSFLDSLDTETVICRRPGDQKKVRDQEFS